MKPTVSIIVPVYNVEKYLERCLNSICAQTYRELEIILIDDGSTDNCGTICDEFAERDTRIKVVHKQNEGLGFARNTGLDIAHGTYIMFVDSDDLLSENAVSTLYERIVADGTQMAVGKFVFSYEDGHEDEIYCRWIRDAVITPHDALKETQFPVCAWGKLYKRQVFSSLRYPSAACAEDLWIYPLLIEKTNRISMVNSVVYHYFQRSNSLVWSRTDRTLEATLKAKLNMAEYLLSKGYKRQARHFYHTAIGTAAHFENKQHGKQLIYQTTPKEKRRQLTSATAHIRWLGIRYPGLYRGIYRFSLKILRIARLIKR